MIWAYGRQHIRMGTADLGQEREGLVGTAVDTWTLCVRASIECNLLGSHFNDPWQDICRCFQNNQEYDNREKKEKKRRPKKGQSYGSDGIGMRLAIFLTCTEEVRKKQRQKLWANNTPEVMQNSEKIIPI